MKKLFLIVCLVLIALTHALSASASARQPVFFPTFETETASRQTVRQAARDETTAKAKTTTAAPRHTPAKEMPTTVPKKSAGTVNSPIAAPAPDWEEDVIHEENMDPPPAKKIAVVTDSHDTADRNAGKKNGEFQLSTTNPESLSRRVIIFAFSLFSVIMASLAMYFTKRGGFKRR